MSATPAGAPAPRGRAGPRGDRAPVLRAGFRFPTGKSLGLAEETTSTDRRTGPLTVKAVTRKGLTVDYQVTWAPLNVPHAERAILIEVDQQRPSRTG